MNLSIIIVNYKVRKEIIALVKSIQSSQTKISHEIIVVDNEHDNLLEKYIKKLPKAKYIKSPGNIGFGAGNNLGAKYAEGDSLLFLNPDTILTKNTLDNLYYSLNNLKRAGIVSPLVLDQKGKVFDFQGYGELTPVSSVFSFGLFRKITKKLSVYKNYTTQFWKKEKIVEVKTVFGAAMMIKKSLFEKIKGFDERFFLYFEENDICKRVREKGYKIYVDSNSTIEHKVGKSTDQNKQSFKYFQQSRFLYLRKHYGLFLAFLSEAFVRLNLTTLFIFLIISLSLFLRIYNLNISMSFIGDQGWFYLSARNLLVNGQIPLVGITSSHTWLHQGPLWTYILALGLFIFKFNPLAGGYVTAFLGTVTTYLFYRFGKEMFNKRTGVLAMILYAVSPLIVFSDRMPFDPSIIPLFAVLYLYSLYKWIKGFSNYFVFILILLACLYNLELATFTIVFPFAMLFFYGFIKKKSYVKKLNKKIIIFSILGFSIVMLPIFVYDFFNGFKQTLVFVIWILYKPFSFLIKKSQPTDYYVFFDFLKINIQKLIFNYNFFVAFILLISSISYTFYKSLKSRSNESFQVLSLILLFTILGVLVNRIPSDAYLPILFPFLIISFAIILDAGLKIKYLNVLLTLIILVIFLLNLNSSFQNTFKNDYKERIDAVDKIISLVEKNKYNIIGRGEGSQFSSFTMNYEYLLWWKGFPVSKNNEALKILISEDKRGIHIVKK